MESEQNNFIDETCQSAERLAALIDAWQKPESIINRIYEAPTKSYILPIPDENHEVL